MSEQPGTIGPYRVLELLGQGGMGVVYRCEHLRTGRLAAVKTVRVAHAGLLNRIRREIHALARTRHPGIVPIVEHGAQAGLPWYAMELVEGVTLRKFWSQMTGRAEAVTPGAPPETAVESSATHTAEGVDDHARTASPFATAVRRGPDWRPPTEPQFRTVVRPAGNPGLKPTVPEFPAQRPKAAAGQLGAALRLIRRLCVPLAYLHGEGLVHRDIKPANIIVRPDGWPVLVDFGLMAQSLGPAGREVLEEEGETVGTTAYMAPEQIRGDLVDARADLYALGCILYELVAGRVPFTGRTLGEVLYQHCEVAPAALSRVAEGVPCKLDLLVARLLAKEPHERLGYADDVAAALQALGVDEPAEPRNPASRPYLYRPRLAGREKVLYEVRRRLDRLETGSGGLVLIGGESGVGKTRLVMEVARQARIRRLNVFLGECLRESSATLQPLRRTLQAIADRCRERGPTETERLVGGRLALLSLHEPSLRALTGESAAAALLELSPEAFRRRLFEDLCATLEALARGKSPENGERATSSLVLILDDLQWADTLTLDFLQFLVERRRLEEMGMLVLGTYRSEELEPGVTRLLESPETRSLRLERLEPRSVSAMVQDMLAMAQSPARFVQALATQSEGNPFFVAEYLRTAIAEGALTRDTEGRWQLTEGAGEALPLPRALRDLVVRRFERLGSGARRVLDACSVLGREMDPALLAELADAGDHERLDALDELLARQVLEEGTAGRLRFVHDKLREVAYAGIECPRRETLHRAAAEAIEKQPPELKDELLATVAEHWEAAGEPAEAARSYLAAARRARGRYAHKEAERLYRACLRMQERPSLQGVEARDELAMTVLNLQGRPAEAFCELRLGLQEARRLEDRAAESRLLRSLAVVTVETGHLEEAREMIERALALAVEAQNRWHQFQSLETLATIHYQEGSSERARQLLEQALAICRADGHRQQEAVLIGTLGSVCFQQGALEEARELHDHALTLKRKSGDVRGEGLSLTNLAEVLVSLGRLPEAEGLLEQALALKRSAGDRRGEGITLLSMSQLHGDSGRPVEARRFVEAALPILRAVESRQFEGLAIGYQAVLERRYGDLSEAAKLETQAELILLEVGDRSNSAVCVAQRGHTSLAKDDVVGAKAALAQARELAGVAVRPVTDVGRALSGLERAITAAEAGCELVRGEAPEVMATGLREWFEAGRNQTASAASGA